MESTGEIKHERAHLCHINIYSAAISKSKIYWFYAEQTSDWATAKVMRHFENNVNTEMERRLAT